MNPRVLCLLLLSLSGWVTSSNVDTTGAIWFRGDERSYFGYSVNLYRYRNKPSMRYVLIGAPRANSSSAVFQTGNTFRCDVLDPGSCIALDLPGLDTANEVSEISETGGGDIEDKANMWMGGTVTSSYDTGVVVTSGHRYFRVGSNAHDPIGLSYVLPDPLGTGVKLSPCAGNNCAGGLGGFGYCMSGISTLILSDGSQLYIGATGYDGFRGSLFRGFQSTNCLTGIYRAVGYFGYFGYSLTSGRILDRNEETVVASGPRQNAHLGNIYFFNNNSDFVINDVQSIHGTTQDSYYGFSLLAVDLNGDGMDELLVSSPMYSLPGTPEVGQVLVYPNIGTGLGIATTFIQQIPYGRFGTAMADLGDLNQDSYPEIAISSPYGQQAGTVFIYSGTSQGSLTTQPIQTIRGEDVGLEIGAAFGASISGKRDIDDNGYNDILVGAYVNSSAFLLRTLPIVSVLITPSNTPMFPIIDIPVARDAGLTENLTSLQLFEDGEYIFFTLSFRISYTSLGESPPTIRVNLTVTSDPERQSSRVFFLEGNTPIRTFQTSLVLNRDVEQSMSMRVYIVNLGTEAYTFDFSYLVDNPAILDFNTSVVLANPGSVPRFLVQPDLDCGTDSECIPDLYIYATAVFPAKGTDPTDRYTEIIAGEVNEFSIDITVGNQKENSFGTRMSLTIPPGTSFRIATIDNADLVIACQNPQSSNGFVTLTCSPLGRPLGRDQVIQFSIVLGTESLSGNEGTLLVQMTVLSNNPDANSTLGNNTVNVTVPVTAVADISVSVEVRPDRLSFNETTELRIQDLVDDVNNEFYTLSNLGSEIIYTFTVRNAGPSPILNSVIEIDWPLGLRNSSYLDDLSRRDYFLYITNIDSSIVLCDSTYVNIRNLRTSTVVIDEGNNPNTEGRRRRDVPSLEDTGSLEQKREKRQTTVEVDPEFNTDVDQDSYPNSYIKIVCDIGTFPGSTEYELQVTAQVFEPTLVDRAALNTWTFDVGVTARITDTHVTQPDEHEGDSSSITVTLIPSSIFVRVEGFTLWWVIVVAIAVFIALLIPVFLVLYFAGFFKKDKAKRAKTDEEQRRLQLWNDQKKGGDKPF